MRSFHRRPTDSTWPPWLHPRDERAVLVDIDLRAEAQRSRIVGAINRRLKVAVAASSWGAEANRQLVRFLCHALRIAHAQVAIVGGHAGRKKTVCLLGVAPERVLLGLAPRVL